MQLDTLLKELRENMLRDVSDLVNPTDAELQASYLWTDETLIRYINEGYFRLAERGFLLKDGTTPATSRIEMVAGQENYDLHPAVLTVYSVATQGRRQLQRLTHPTLTGANADLAYLPPFTLEARTGNPRSFTTDEENSVLRIYPAPDSDLEGQMLHLRVARLPLEKLAMPADGSGDPIPEPELPERYHLDILEWAAYLALRNHDTDVDNLRSATHHRNSFTRRLEEARSQHQAAMMQIPQFAFNARY